jgi:hypothetical protein
LRFGVSDEELIAITGAMEKAGVNNDLTEENLSRLIEVLTRSLSLIAYGQPELINPSARDQIRFHLNASVFKTVRDTYGETYDATKQ